MIHDHPAPSPFRNPVVRWVDERLPVFSLLSQEYAAFPSPRNFNYLWNFGAIALFMLVIMIATGIVLAMNYTPHTTLAFASVEHMVRDVNFGWLVRALHANGASFFFVAVYIHILRGLYYGSYKKPRELLWILGVVILLIMMATAFMGYVLPWGQMSLWGATVITSLFSAIPVVGESVVNWLWGGFSVENPTLNRFFALHYLLPFLLLGVVFLHVMALHVVGSNNPLGIETKGPQDTVPFHPYYTLKDLFGLTVFLCFFAVFVFWMPDVLGHPDNYTPANPMVTPPHIVPEWYFLPFYAILRSITFNIPLGLFVIEAKLLGVVAMFGAIALLFVLPWLDTHPVRSARFRPVYRWFFFLWVLACVALGYAGSQPAEGLPVVIGQVATVYYFLFFLVITPVLSRVEKALPLPVSIAESVLQKKGPAAVMVSVMLLLLLSTPAAFAKEGGTSLVHRMWPHAGVTGTYDRAALQRGFQVYREVCSSCHGLHLLSYRNLSALGYTPGEVKAVAASVQVTDGPGDDGEMFERPGLPSDRFKSPFPNDNAARAANGGALPPDLSLIVKARAGHEDYVYSLLTGFRAPPANFALMEGMQYNIAFPGHQIAMPPPLSDGAVTYADGTPATVDQMSADVTQFLAWAGDPHMEARKQTGVAVLIFLTLLGSVLYALKRAYWRRVGGH